MSSQAGAAPRILVVKLSSLGDVVHAMPAVQDMRQALPGARIDWVVERGFAPLVRRCQGVQRVIECELRRWTKAPLARPTREAWRAFRRELRLQPYDAVVDLQGLTKSALVARTARLAEGGRRYALANRTEGSSWEAPTRWVADVAVRIEPRIHAVDRSRELCARALGYAVSGPERFGLVAAAGTQPSGEVALVHGTSRDDKLWPEDHWIDLGRRLQARGHRLGLPHGSDAERERAARLAAALPGAAVWPRLDLGLLTDRLAGCQGVIGVDSGLSHIATALDLPHVQVYNFDTAWRTGPVGRPRQRGVFAAPTPPVDAVWAAWEQVSAA
ncbi:lipopolysaccharide heptosyltransferase I [Ramlibacter sp. AW1]|uniref:Lipopolysaccharide heptosyltransferase 1 n=1 Tax=Ramlibacter aurantiacus TaxID=2801330 RepID=A0A936ZUW3_9BURK|nr:lipopolysaccharide heptosyltransferase I [Ramlibacter aurantiacus]MBL0421019.1 lipopolysaccharide heptosyltransferase I [Ramlibacter aurantiacus]